MSGTISTEQHPLKTAEHLIITELSELGNRFLKMLKNWSEAQGGKGREEKKQ